MKKIIHFAFVFCCLILQSHVWANTVIVKGYVKDSANHAVANRTVKIYSSDSINQGCIVSHISVTNPNGYYMDTLTCTGDIRKLSIIVENCNGSKITNTILVTSSNMVESNFIICVSPAIVRANCKSTFSYTSVLTGIKFNSAGSEAPDGDSIISRIWSFGDRSETVAGNNVDPSHTYKKPGTYSVCLTVKTKKGCESKYCSTVVFTPESKECRVEVFVNTEKTGNRKFRFISSQSHTLAGDSIVQRTWKFGDGSSLDGNQLYLTKEYKDTGVYNVCVQVRTAKGCEKLYCFTLTVRDSSMQPPGINCKALFTFSSTQASGAATGIRFDASASSVPAGDSIIGRSWSFGDSTGALTGNSIDPTHVFSKAGTYHVCLTIKTKKGCESNYCTTVVFTPLNTCFVQVHANTERISAKKFRFTSNTVSVAPGDSIIRRVWKFGDNTSLEGNEIYPVKEYRDTGVFTVCVTVKTARGCENKHCFTVTIHDSTMIQPKPANCKAYFTYVIKDSTIRFNSAGSTVPDVDSIISRTWYYIDSAKHSITTISGNVIDTFFTYTKPGTYSVYLIIKTKKGCESKYAATVVIVPTPIHCEAEAYFTAERVGLKKVQFNSSYSKARQGDSIIQRRWKFGDGTGKEGNNLYPLKEFPLQGVYSTCLQIKTAKGCETQFCRQVIVQDSIGLPHTSVDLIKIISINPNPVTTRMLVTIWCRNNNTEVEISIHDIYGTGKLHVKKILTQGNNAIEMSTDFLNHGPYFLKVSAPGTRNARDTKTFYKL